MRRASAALGAAIALSACGGNGEPGLPAALADRTAAEADATAELLEAGDDCEAAERASGLVHELVEAINARRVPDGLQEELLGRANELAARVRCPGPSEPEATPVARDLADWVRGRRA
jgi:hypothetical protein